MVQKWPVLKCIKKEELRCILSEQILIMLHAEALTKLVSLVLKFGFAVVKFMVRDLAPNFTATKRFVVET